MSADTAEMPDDVAIAIIFLPIAFLPSRLYAETLLTLMMLR